MSKPRVLLNGVCNNRHGRLLGNFYHMRELAAQLHRQQTIDFRLLADEFTIDEYRQAVPEAKIVFSPIGRLTLWRRDLAVRRIVSREQFDVYHRPTGQLPLVALPCREVMTIADLNFEHLPVGWSRRWYKRATYRRSIRRATWITCISKFTEDDVLKHFPEARGKTSVIYHGAADRLAVPPNENLPSPVDAPFFLTFAHQPHKNLDACLRAMVRLAAVPPCATHRLKVVGAHGKLLQESQRLAAQLGIAPQIDFLGRVSDEQLRQLYVQATALLFMSRFEGFGLPALEAMTLGCPVIASNACSLPEVVGEAGTLLDPDDVGGLAHWMERFCQTPQLREEFAAAGRRQARQFSWETAAQQTAEVYVQTAQLG